MCGVLILTESYSIKLYEKACEESNFKSKAVDHLKEWSFNNEKNSKSADALIKRGEYSIALAEKIKNTPRPKNFNIGTLYQDYIKEQEDCKDLIRFLCEDIKSAKGADNYAFILNQATANIEKLKKLFIKLGELAEDLKKDKV